MPISGPACYLQRMKSVTITISVEAGDWPPKRELQALARRAIDAAVEVLELEPRGELSLAFTDDARMREINKAWRGKDSPTNVLSFPAARAAQPEGTLLGDVILSAETVAKEAELADKPLEDHMAHLLIHGFLHLLGHDHKTGPDAEKMEQLERVALKRVGIPDPYAAPRGR
jgi:probable rRNA maturation factor